MTLIESTNGHVVYVLDHPEQGVIYVGCTNDFNRRHAEHSRRPEFAGAVMREVAQDADRVVAEALEARLIQIIRPRHNRTAPANASGYAKREQFRTSPLGAAFAMFEAVCS